MFRGFQLLRLPRAAADSGALRHRELHTKLPSMVEDAASAAARTVGTALADANAKERLVDAASLPSLPSIDAAYLAQRFLIHSMHHEHKLPLAGWKIGATAAVAQHRLQLPGPFYGPVFRRDITKSPANVVPDPARLRLRGVEAEYVFTMGKTLPLQATDFSEAEVLDAVSVVCPAIEVCASRLSAPAGTSLTIADQASHGKLVLGWQYRIPAQQWRERFAPALADFPVSLRCGGKEVARGDGTAVLNNPSHALTWLANELRRANLQLRAGDFVTTGTMTDLTPVQAGQAWSAEFTGLGVVRVSFAEGAPSALSDGDWADLTQQAAAMR